MTDRDLTLLLVLLWLGFSFAFLIVAWSWRFTLVSGKVQFREKEVTIKRVRFPMRLAISVIGLAGAFGAASLTGMLLKEIKGSEIAFLVGVGLGLWAAIAFYPWSNRDSGSPPADSQRH